MSYHVLARKWRPQRFDDVVGQQAVTRTLANALKSGRLAQAFVFAGPRGCGKTTTARVLARALNCVDGPTPIPCGACDACVEIAEGRDIDVLEIDAATHTGVDNVREVIIEGLSITPVRNRYKVFLIDEVHMLSSSSFNALLKSIEEPPPHVVFMMATTELAKIPDTVRSRSQVYEFKTISTRVVADRLRFIANEESIQIGDAALLLLARAGEGSLRDSLSAFDQVRAFAGDAIAVDDIVAVLGLVGRDLVFDMLEAVAREDASAAFALVEKAMERGYDPRALCRELARATRDLLILSVDPSRLTDTDVAAESERDRLIALAAQSSREDLLRAFDVLTRAEEEIRISEQARFNLEMALVRMMHLRKLVPLTELLAGGGLPAATSAPRTATARPSPPTRSAPPAPPAVSSPPALPAPPVPDLKSAFIGQIRASKVFFYNTVVAQAYSVDVAPTRITFTFLPNQRVPKQQCDEARAWLEGIAEKVAGRKIPVSVAIAESSSPRVDSQPSLTPTAPSPAPDTRPPATEEELRQQAMADPTVQALFEIFPVEKSRVEEV
jgi:DNA polymerase-3 subunit gamma/tau